MNWVIVEDRYQVHSARRWTQEQGVPYRFLTTTPAAYQECVACGVPVKSLHEFTSEDDLNDLAWANIRDSEIAVEQLGTIWKGLCPEAQDGFAPFQAILYQLKVTADAVTFRARQLGDFCEMVRPVSIAYWVDGYGDSSDDVGESSGWSASIRFRPGASIVAALLGNELWRDTHGVRCVEMDVSTGVLPQDRPKHGRVRNLTRQILNGNRVAGVKFLRTQLFHGVLKRHSNTQPLLVIDENDYVRSFLRYPVRHQLASVDWWTDWKADPVSLPTLRRIQVFPVTSTITITEDKVMTCLKKVKGLGLWSAKGDSVSCDILLRRIGQFVWHSLPCLDDLYARASTYFAQRRPIAVLSGTATGADTQTIAQAARHHGAEVVIFQHGGCYGYCEQPYLSLGDLKVADVFATFGPGVSEDLGRQAEKEHLATRFADIGWATAPTWSCRGISGQKASQSLDGMGLSKGRAKILYVPTGLMGNMRYGPYHDFDDTHYFLHQMDVVNALRRLETCDTLVKLHYKNHAEVPLAQYVQDAGYTNVQVLEKGKMVELLPFVDIVIIDYASTTLLEALAAKKNVIFLDIGVHRLLTHAKDLIKEKVIWIEKRMGWESELREAINRCFDQRITDAPEAGFMEKYGNPRFQPEALWGALVQLKGGL